MLGTSNYVNCSRRNRKRSAKYVYHTGTLVSFIARAGTSCIKKEERISNSSIFRWTFFQFRSTSPRKDDLMDIDMGKSQETNNIIWLTSWRRNARKSISKESMIDSYEIQNSVIEWLKIIETKNFAENLMLLRMKIIPTMWPHKNTLSTRVTGGFIRTSKVPILCERGTDLTSKKASSTLQQLKQKRKRSLTSAHELSQKSTMGTKFFFMVELARFMVDSLFQWKSRWRWTKYWQNGVTCCTVFGTILRSKTFLNSVALLQMDRLQLTAVYCNRRGCKQNTSNDMFSLCKSVQ